MTGMTIGQLASSASVSVETIRYYQRRGLLNEPPKPLGGYRHYPPSATRRLRFIRRAQALGFMLDEVAGLLQLEEARACSDTRAFAERKIDLIEEKIAGLALVRGALADLVKECDTDHDSAVCPIIDVLAQD